MSVTHYSYGSCDTGAPPPSPDKQSEDRLSSVLQDQITENGLLDDEITTSNHNVKRRQSPSTSECIRTEQVDRPDLSAADGEEDDDDAPLPALSSLPDVRDRGYAWVTIAVMGLINMISNGYMRASGIICNAVIDTYPGISTAVTSLIIASLGTFRNILAPIVGAASEQFGYRAVMLCGALLCSAALMTAAFANNVACIVLSLGAMMGMGMSLLETPQVIVLSDYFDRRKELADSLRVAGNPIGGIILSFLFVSLHESVGIKLTFVFMSAILLQTVVPLCLIRPYHVQQKITQARKSQLTKTYSNDCEREQMKKAQIIEIHKKDAGHTRKKFDFILFKDPIYLTYIAMIFCWGLGFPHMFYFIPMYGRSINLSPTQNSTLIAYQSTLDCINRIITGMLLNRRMFEKRHYFTGCMLVGGAGICLIPFCGGFWTMICAMTLTTFCSTGFFTCLNGLLIDQFGRDNISSSYGFIRMIQGFFCAVLPPLLGLIVDVTGSFIPSFLVMGGGVMMAGICIALQPLIPSKNLINQLR
uniref:Monocarboxylate transporter 2-like n=1 Tax=Hirondellea gigas TaxID=1518452 RepID=A0A2P2I0M9_9CRUS